MSLKQVVEALVFASPKPLTTKEMISALKAAGDPAKTEDQTALGYAKAKEPDILEALAQIVEELKSTGRAFRLQEQINGWSFVTDPGAVQWVRKLYPEAKPTRLTGPQLETLAIIAYRQPVTRADMEAVRGVAVDSVVQMLLERSLIKIAGRADVPGRPLLYETTEYFLQHFGIKSVDELPNSAELKRVELPKAPVPEPEGEQAKAAAVESEQPPTKPTPVAETQASEPVEEAPVSGESASTETEPAAEEPAPADPESPETEGER